MLNILAECLKARYILEDLSIDGKAILKTEGKGLDGVDWVHLAQDRDQRQALINKVTKFPVP
jgi:hypothetical protein